MTSGQLVKVVAEATGVAEATVAVLLRFLREAGMITTGARGVNAPPMTYLDAARLVIAILVTDRPARGVDAVTDFGQLIADHVEPHEREDGHAPFDLQVTADLGRGHTFESGLAALIKAYAEDRDTEHFQASMMQIAEGMDFLPVSVVEVDLHRHVAQIFMPGARYVYSDRDLVHSVTLSPDQDPGRSPEETFRLLSAQQEVTDRYFKRFEKYHSKISVKRAIAADVIDDIAFGFVEGANNG